MFCDIVEQERGDGRRGSWARTTSSWRSRRLRRASRSRPGSCRSATTSHFEEGDASRLGQLAEILRLTLTRIGRALDRPPYNFVLHTRPCNQGTLEHYHWHFEIMPTLTKTAGFEWGTGFHINPTPPEEAAEYLREIQIRETETEDEGRTHHRPAER